jgi:hypothetical protein
MDDQEKVRYSEDYIDGRLVDDVISLLRRERTTYSLGKRIEGGDEEFNYPICEAVFTGRKGVQELVDALWAQKESLGIRNITVDGEIKVEFCYGDDRIYGVNLDETFRSVSLRGI